MWQNLVRNYLTRPLAWREQKEQQEIYTLSQPLAVTHPSGAAEALHGLCGQIGIERPPKLLSCPALNKGSYSLTHKNSIALGDRLLSASSPPEVKAMLALELSRLLRREHVSAMENDLADGRFVQLTTGSVRPLTAAMVRFFEHDDPARASRPGSGKRFGGVHQSIGQRYLNVLEAAMELEMPPIPGEMAELKTMVGAYNNHAPAQTETRAR